MTGQCCTGEGRLSLARRLSATAAPVLPGAVLLLLPKCPLCLAAWLTVALGGAAVSATAAEQIRWVTVVFWLVALVIAGIQVIWRRYSAACAANLSIPAPLKARKSSAGK
jgi:hypothetical protein